jgi:hypothetical protein
VGLGCRLFSCLIDRPLFHWSTLTAFLKLSFFAYGLNFFSSCGRTPLHEERGGEASRVHFRLLRRALQGDCPLLVTLRGPPGRFRQVKLGSGFAFQQAPSWQGPDALLWVDDGKAAGVRPAIGTVRGPAPSRRFAEPACVGSIS